MNKEREDEEQSEEEEETRGALVRVETRGRPVRPFMRLRVYQ